MAINNISIFEHQTPAGIGGIDGGTINGGLYNTRPLNTEIINTISGCSLISNQITLPIGNYYFYGWAVAFNTNRNQLRFYNNSTSTYFGSATTQYSSTSSAYIEIVKSIIHAEREFTQIALIDFLHYAETTCLNNGMGLNLSGIMSSTNVYAHLYIRKMT